MSEPLSDYVKNMLNKHKIDESIFNAYCNKSNPKFFDDLSPSLKELILTLLEKEFDFIEESVAIGEFNELTLKVLLAHSGKLLGSMKPNNRTEELCKIAVSKNGYALRFVPHNLMTEEITKIALKNLPKAWIFVKDEFKNSLDFQLWFIEINGMFLELIEHPHFEVKWIAWKKTCGRIKI